MDLHIRKILQNFGLKMSRVYRPSDAMLAQVYVVDDQFILRSRPYESDTPVRFAPECNLCDQVARVTGFRFPEYLQSASGNYFVIDSKCFWTLHQLIPGQPLGSWFELHKIKPVVNHQVLNVLRQLHEKTAGLFTEELVNRKRLLELVTPSMVEAHNFLSTNALDRVRRAFESVEHYCMSYPVDECCFVHGDFHHGNILAENGQIVGFIDLDWCRASNIYEDLAFTLMMMLRDYLDWSHDFSESEYKKILSYYSFSGDFRLLNDHLILYALFDCIVFKLSQFENSTAFFEYQKRFVEELCRSLPAKAA